MAPDRLSCRASHSGQIEDCRQHRKNCSAQPDRTQVFAGVAERVSRAQPANYLFPAERYGGVPNDGSGYMSEKCLPYSVDPSKPIGSWKVSWTAARKAASVSCRWHDLRHSFVSRMAESQASDATIMSLAGHLSRKMMERYSHTRNEAKRQAVVHTRQAKRLKINLPQ